MVSLVSSYFRRGTHPLNITLNRFIVETRLVSKKTDQAVTGWETIQFTHVTQKGCGYAKNDVEVMIRNKALFKYLERMDHDPKFAKLINNINDCDIEMTEFDQVF
jgi:hypothetical protein